MSEENKENLERSENKFNEIPGSYFSPETEKTQNSENKTNISENNFNKNSEVEKNNTENGDKEFDYATMPGSWANYQAGQGTNLYGENGVYPENGFNRPSGEKYFSKYDTQKDQSYFDNYNRTSGNLPMWDSGNNPESRKQNPKKIKKKNIFFGVIGSAVVVLLLVCAVLLQQNLQKIKNDLENPSGGPENGIQQTPTDENTVTSNKEHLQNGNFVLEQVSEEEHYKFSSVYQLTESTVVAISSSIGSGSGVIISKDETNNDGYFIVTNNHVVEDGNDFKVTLSNGTEYSAILMGRDENTDLAVIKVLTESELSVASLGKSEELLVAEEVLIIGNPLGTLGGTATNGILSAKDRQITIDGYTMTLMQTNAAVNPGNSGGGMFNMSGQLVGVVNAKISDETVEGIGFAIPIDLAKPIIEDLTNYGYVKGRPNHGFKVEYGANLLVDSRESYWVTEIRAGSDAAVAGLKVDDRVMSLKVNGESYTGNNLSVYLNTLKPGDEIDMVVYRYSFGGFYPSHDVVEIKITVTEYTG